MIRRIARLNKRNCFLWRRCCIERRWLCLFPAPCHSILMAVYHRSRSRSKRVTNSHRIGISLPFQELSFPTSCFVTLATRVSIFSAIVTAPTNRRFPRVIMNRLWHRYLGWSIVEPIDDWGSVGDVDSRLLDWLERDFVMAGYDLKHAARSIFLSQVYQSAALNQKEIASAKLSKQLANGPARRRLSAEQLIDSLFAMSGKAMDLEPMSLDPEGRRPPEQFLHLGFPTRAWQLASTSTDRDRPALMLPALQQVSDVMMSFGWRDSRPTPLSVRDESASPLQSLILGNGLASTRIARLSDDSLFTELAWSATAPRELVENLTLTVLGRTPTEEERMAYEALLSPGFSSRRLHRSPTLNPVASHKRNAVSWANHLVPEATRIKLLLEQEILRGDIPTQWLESDWRDRMEDAIWSLMNSPEFLFVP